MESQRKLTKKIVEKVSFFFSLVFIVAFPQQRGFPKAVRKSILLKNIPEFNFVAPK